MSIARVALLVSLGTWVAAVGLGVGALSRYSGSAGTPTEAPPVWPAASAIARATDRSTLLLFAHPECMCTEATLGEFDWLVTRIGDEVDAKIRFVRPVGAAPGWGATAIVARAHAIEGVDVAIDAGGVEAERFGAMTSGAVLLYSAAGELLFSGGITGARAHAGDNPGRSRVFALVLTARADRATSPVFGCGLTGGAPWSF